jgi:hypothetical protein
VGESGPPEIVGLQVVARGCEVILKYFSFWELDVLLNLGVSVRLS